MNGKPDPEKVYLALDDFWIEIDGRGEAIGKGSPRMGDDPAVIKGFPKLWIEAGLDPETKARRRLDEMHRGLEPASEPEKSYSGLTLRMIQETYRLLEKEDDGPPTRLRVATALYRSESTLKRAGKALKKPRWPPF